MNRPTLPQALIVAAAFLAPICGGQVNTEGQMIGPSFAAILSGTLRGVEAPGLARALITLLISVALIIMFVRRDVYQVPSPKLLGAMTGFFGLLTLSLFFTKFHSVAIASLAQWLAYGLAMLTVVAGAGRRGAFWVMAALHVGCAVVAAVGIREYIDMWIVDASWRIFATWTPNTLAGILGIGLIIGLALTASSSGLVAACYGFSAAMTGTALALTQSRGGMATAAIGIVVFFFFMYFWSKSQSIARQSLAKAGAATLAAPLLLFVILGLLTAKGKPALPAAEKGRAQIIAQQPVEPSALGRLGQPAATREQSFGFRLNLWRGAGALALRNPLGTGIGTYRFESSKSGLTTQTHFAHNSYLELAVEAGVLAPFALLAVIGFWAAQMLRTTPAPIGLPSVVRVVFVVVAVATLSFRMSANIGIALTLGLLSGGAWLIMERARTGPTLPDHQNALRAAVIGAIVATLLHNVIDSDLYSFGIGWSFFVLLGAGLLLSSDGIAPEYSSPSTRIVGMAGALLISGVLLHAGTVEVIRSRARYERNENRFEEAYALSKLATAISPNDGENYRLAATLATSFERGDALKRAAELHPNTRNLRQYGTHLLGENDFALGVSYLRKSLEIDPNNLLTLAQLMEELARYGDTEESLVVARRLVEVEKSPYFTIRSLPEFVPTETYAARIFIAQRTADRAERIRLLEGAVEGYGQYANLTIPQLKMHLSVNPNGEMGGETLDGAQLKLTIGGKAARQLADDYRAGGRPPDADRALATAKGFEAMAAGLK